MTWIEPIRTPSLILRELVLEDATEVYRMSLEAGMRQWLPDQVYRDESQARQVLRTLTAFYHGLPSPVDAPCVLGVVLQESGRLIGHVGLSPLRGCAEIGCAIETAHQGNGYGTQAVSAMTRCGHRAFHLPVILGVVAAENVGSCHVLEKCGYVLADERPGVLHGRHGPIRTYESSAPAAPPAIA